MACNTEGNTLILMVCSVYPSVLICLPSMIVSMLLRLLGPYEKNKYKNKHGCRQTSCCSICRVFM